MKFLKMVVLVAFFMSMPGVTWSLEQKDPFVQSFVSSGATLETYDIVDWSVINRDFMSFSDIEKKAEKIAELFGANGQNFKIAKESDKMYRIINMEGELDSDTFLQIIIQSVALPEEYDVLSQTYLVLTVTGRDIEKIKEHEAKIKKVMITNGGQSRITTCIMGSFDGKLKKASQDEVLKKLSEVLKVDKLKPIEDDYTTSAIGYSPLLDGRIDILGESYNLNIAFRYNSEDDKTYIWIGTPVISVEY